MKNKIFNKMNVNWNESEEYNQTQFLCYQQYFNELIRVRGYVHTIEVLISLDLIDRTDVDKVIDFDENSKESVFDFVNLGNNEFEIIFSSIKQES